MNEISRRLMGVVSEFPRQPQVEVDHVCRELREVLEENDRLIERNRALQRRLAASLERNAELKHGVVRVLRYDAAADWGSRADLALGRLRLNYEMRALELDGRSVQLTARGLELIGYLMRRPERVVQCRELAEVLGLDPSGGAVRTLIWRTRQHLAEIGAGGYLQTYGRTWSGGGYWMSVRHEGGQQ